jgi:hypothetical protein
LLLAGPAMAQSLPGSRYPITKVDVAKELDVVGVNVEASQVHIPSGMSADSSSPKLEIVTAEPMGDNQVRLQLRCSTNAECLPFFTTLDVKEANLISAEIRAKSGGATASNRQMAMQVGAGRVSQPQIRVGSHAVLIMQDGHMDIHLQVVAIDAGIMGQQVRVSTLDRRKIFHATVTGDGTVAGAIE